MAIDLIRARRETPGCERVAHFNNAGAGLLPQPVLQAMTGHLKREALGGGYEAAAAAHGDIERIYDAAAGLLNCTAEEIAIVENATRAWDMAFYSMRFSEGDRILTARAEYASNYIAYLQVARKTGVKIDAIANDEHGQVSIEALENAIDTDVKLISMTHVPTNGGLVNPAAEIGRVARAADIPFLLDACQSVGQMPIDVAAIGCDILSATGRKYLRGPRGTGLLYVRRGLIEALDPPFLDLHSAAWTARDEYKVLGNARRFETWEGNVAGKIGLGVAIDYARGWGLQDIWARVEMLGESLRAQLGDIPGVSVRDLGRTRCGIVTFTKDGISAEDIQAALAQRSINISVTTTVSTRLDMEARDLDALARASVHYYNSEEEVARFCDAIASA